MAAGLNATFPEPTNLAIAPPTRATPGAYPTAPGTVIPVSVLQSAIAQAVTQDASQFPTGMSATQAYSMVYQRLLVEENGGADPGPNGSITVTGSSTSGASGIIQAFQPALNDYNTANNTGYTTTMLASGALTAQTQMQIMTGIMANYATQVAANNPGLTGSSLATAAGLAYNIGVGGLQRAVADNVPGGVLTNANLAQALPALKTVVAAANKAGSAGAAAAAAASYVAGAVPATEAASAAAPVHPLVQANSGNAYAPESVIWDGLNNTPWWKLEGALVGNPALRRVPDAISFMLTLPPRDTGDYLTTVQGGQEKVVVRLNVGLQSIGQGASHQNSVEPTATGLLLNLWDSKPDMITAAGTTGTFMNAFGITSLMSATGSPAASAFLSTLVATFGNRNAAATQNANGLRVAAQDAFMELWALFKNNGIIRYHPQAIQDAAENGLMVNNATNLSGYQMRHRLGDVLGSGYVAMIYKDRTLMGRFKSFDLTANADSPYRWDFNFTFRVMSDFTPYNVQGVM
jgi:hypothetical protein